MGIKAQVCCNAVFLIWVEIKQHLLLIMRWHQRLGHISIRKVHGWCAKDCWQTQNRPKSYIRQLQSWHTERPMCTACQEYAKQRRKAIPGTKQRRKAIPGTAKILNKGEQNALKTNKLFPGSLISVDQFQRNPRGQLELIYGKEKTTTSTDEKDTRI